MICVDTNVFVDHIRGKVEAKEFFNNCEEACTSILVLMEVLVGFKSKQEILGFEKFLAKFHIKIFNVNEEISQKAYAFLKENFHRMSIGILDSLILATAYHYGLDVVTTNTKHFNIQDGEKVKIFKPY